MKAEWLIDKTLAVSLRSADMIRSSLGPLTTLAMRRSKVEQVSGGVKQLILKCKTVCVKVQKIRDETF